jgi:hypothetical protein
LFRFTDQATCFIERIVSESHNGTCETAAYVATSLHRFRWFRRAKGVYRRARIEEERESQAIQKEEVTEVFKNRTELIVGKKPMPDGSFSRSRSAVTSLSSFDSPPFEQFRVDRRMTKEIGGKE